MNLVETTVEIANNVLLFDAYRRSSRLDQRAFYAERMRLGKIFVYLKCRSGVLFCPSRFAGYKGNTMARHLAFGDKSGSVTTPKITSIVGNDHASNSQAEIDYQLLCTTINITPSSKSRTYWSIKSDGQEKFFGNPELDSDSGFPDEVRLNRPGILGGSFT